MMVALIIFSYCFILLGCSKLTHKAANLWFILLLSHSLVHIGATALTMVNRYFQRICLYGRRLLKHSILIFSLYISFAEQILLTALGHQKHQHSVFLHLILQYFYLIHILSFLNASWILFFFFYRGVLGHIRI